MALDPVALDRWLTTDREGERYEADFEAYSLECDTDANRRRLATNMADSAIVTFQKMPRRGDDQINRLQKAMFGWLDDQDGADVLAWMANEGIVPTFDAWRDAHTPEPPCEPEDREPMWEE